MLMLRQVGSARTPAPTREAWVRRSELRNHDVNGVFFSTLHHDMDGSLPLHAGLAGPRSYHPQLTSSRPETRVTSDPEKKPQSQSPHSHKHKSSRHHHDSRHGHHRHSSSKRHAAKEAMQSAIQIQPPTSFGDLLRQARGSRDTSPSHSRRESVVPRQGHGSANHNEKNTPGIAIPPRRPLRPADVELEAQRVEARERDLRAALQSLSKESLDTSRRLDETYYSILEKLSVLRQTIGTLQALSNLTRELHGNFESDTTALVDDVTGQVEAFGVFKTQQEQVSGLEERIKAGKERADALTARLDRAKERVHVRAESEAQWQAKNAHCVRICWAVSGVLATVLFVFILFQPLESAHNIVKQPNTVLDSASRDAILNADIPDMAKEAIIGPSAPRVKPIVKMADTTSAWEEDERLRAFDEL